MLKATSSAVRSEPSWNFTPWRILRVIPILLSVHCQLSTTFGPYFPCRSCWRKRSNTASYIDSRGRFRDPGRGSIEVTVSGKAMVTTCFLWACAGRRAPAAATATTPLPVVLRNVRRLTRMIGVLPGSSAPSVTALVTIGSPPWPVFAGTSLSDGSPPARGDGGRRATAPAGRQHPGWTCGPHQERRPMDPDPRARSGNEPSDRLRKRQAHEGRLEPRSLAPRVIRGGARSGAPAGGAVPAATGRGARTAARARPAAGSRSPRPPGRARPGRASAPGRIPDGGRGNPG